MHLKCRVHNYIEHEMLSSMHDVKTEQYSRNCMLQIIF